MELGALICRRSRLNVPCARSEQDCVARRDGRDRPAAGYREATRDSPTPFAAFVACAKGQVLVRQRAEGVVNAGLWEFPNLDITNTPEASPVDLASACFGFSVPQVELLCSIQHTITRYRIRLDAYWVECRTPSAFKASQCRHWLPSRSSPPRFTSAHKKLSRKRVTASGSKTNWPPTIQPGQERWDARERLSGNCSRGRKTRNRSLRESGRARTSWSRNG